MTMIQAPAVARLLILTVLTDVLASQALQAKAQDGTPRGAAVDASHVGTPLEIAQPDEFGGVASTHILVKLKSDARQRIQMANQDGLANSDPRNQLSERFRTAAVTWQVSKIAPLYGGAFLNPELAAHYGLDRTYVINVPNGTDTETMAAVFAALGGEVESAGYDSIGGVANGDMAEGGMASSQFIPDDTEFPLQWGMHNTGQTILGQPGTPDADIDAPGAWSIHTGNLGTVTVAIISSGLASHMEYGDNAAPFPNGRVVQGYNTVLDSDDPIDLGDTCPFGTQVAGTIAATGNNGQGVAGVTWGAYLMPVKVLTGCNGNVTDLIEGILWAADHGAHVIDMGLQYPLPSPATIATLQSAVDYAHGSGAVLIAAVGNSSFCGTGVVCYPAKAAHVIGVSSTNNKDLFDSSGSTYGLETDIAAPGRNIHTTRPFGVYAFQSGTGMASAHVSGLATLIKSYTPFRTNDQIAEIIEFSVDDLGAPGWDNRFGQGRVNAANALVAALECADPFLPDGTPCTDDGSDCTNDVCMGGACTHPSLGAGTACGDQTPQGDCDQADVCDANGVCVPNYVSGGMECRATAGECDVPESCTGESADCPPDAFLPGGEWTLRSTTGPSPRYSHAMAYDSARGVTVLFGGFGGFGDTWEWDGTTWTLRSTTGPLSRSSHAMAHDSARSFTVLYGGYAGTPLIWAGDTWEYADYLSGGTQCRATTGECDPAEFCTGSSADCPPDAFLPDQTACTDDGNDCADDVCISGACEHPNLDAGTACGIPTPQGNCDQADICDGNGMCVPNYVSGGMECRAATDECDVSESCTGQSANCPSNGFKPQGVACTADEDECTSDQCNGFGACGHPNHGQCGACCLPDKDCLDGMPSGTCEGQSGEFHGAGSACLGDTDGDGIDNQCDNCAGVDDNVFTEWKCSASGTPCQSSTECPQGEECKKTCVQIPTVSQWGLIVMAILLPIGAKVYYGRRWMAS